MRYITDQQAEQYTNLTGIEDQRALIALATRVYNHINRNPFITDTRLRKYAEDQGIDTDQFNLALGLLGEMGKIVPMDLTEADVSAVTDLTPPPAAQPEPS